MHKFIKSQRTSIFIDFSSTLITKRKKSTQNDLVDEEMDDGE
jgi:hypothetical protein